MTLFVGSQLAHGVWQKSNGNMSTVLSPALKEDYRKHLEGEVGLGLIPVSENGTCYFGAIDIDIDTIDHIDLYKKVSKRKLPLSICRSKSGGAHLIVFFKEPYPATQAQSILRKWAGVLGYPSKTEIFPKQTKSTVSTVGNWINLCYFNANNTVRYAIGNNGSLSIEEFLDSIVYYTGKESVDEGLSEDLIQIGEMPPCLKEITGEGIPAGTRNVTLFNFGLFYKKSSPNGWQDKLRYYNQNHCSPPLASREVEALIKSLSDRQYQYQCNESPLCDHCDRKTCLTLQYGIGNKTWQDENNFDEMVATNLRKILTDPPTYILEVNGKDLHLESDQFRQFDKLRKRIFEVHDAIIRPIKQQQWDQQLRILLANKINIQAPEDASHYGSITSKIDDFLSLVDRSKNREDLLRGMPILEGGKILFQVGFLQKYLIGQKVFIENQDLFSALHRRNCGSDTIRIKGKVIRAWSIPVELVNRQSEDYTESKFEEEKGEL